MSVRALFLAMLVWHAVAASGPSQGPPRADKPLTLFMAGDSTMATQAVVPATPGRGWGQMFQPYFHDHVRVDNLASSGQSSKSFRDHGDGNSSSTASSRATL